MDMPALLVVIAAACTIAQFALALRDEVRSNAHKKKDR